jgi:hypothetical protein
LFSGTGGLSTFPPLNKTTGGIFGATAPAVAQPSAEQKNLQQIIQAKIGANVNPLLFFQNASALVKAVSGPERFGDERDKVLAKLNQLLAAAATGNGYYETNSGPAAFDETNPFHRFKSIGYNRLTEYKDADGICSLILQIPISQLDNPQQKQKILDALFTILGNKPTIHAHVQDVHALSDTSTDFVIYVFERERGRIAATELYKYLTQPDKMRMLQQLRCEKVVPHVGVSGQELRSYLKQPPLGIDAAMWAQAIKDNPEPSHLAPHPIRGFEQLIARQKMQTSLVAQQTRLLDDITRRLQTVQSEASDVNARQIISRQRQKQISHRLLRVLATQTLVQRFGMTLSEDEEKLHSHLELINAHVNAPNQIKSQISDLKNLLAENSALLRERFKEQMQQELRFSDLKDLKRRLASNQSHLESLVETVEANRHDLAICENS